MYRSAPVGDLRINLVVASAIMLSPTIVELNSPQILGHLEMRRFGGWCKSARKCI